MISAVITVVCGKASVCGCSNRDAVTTTGVSVLISSFCADAGTVNSADIAEASASGFQAVARKDKTGKVMLSFSKK